MCVWLCCASSEYAQIWPIFVWKWLEWRMHQHKHMFSIRNIVFLFLSQVVFIEISLNEIMMIYRYFYSPSNNQPYGILYRNYDCRAKVMHRTTVPMQLLWRFQLRVFFALHETDRVVWLVCEYGFNGVYGCIQPRCEATSQNRYTDKIRPSV